MDIFRRLIRFRPSPSHLSCLLTLAVLLPIAAGCESGSGRKVSYIEETSVGGTGAGQGARSSATETAKSGSTAENDTESESEPATGYQWTAQRLRLAQMRWSSEDPSLSARYILKVCSECSGAVAKGSVFSGEEWKDGDPQLCDRCVGNGIIFYCRACEGTGFNTTQNEECAACDGAGDFSAKFWDAEAQRQFVEAFIVPALKESLSGSSTN